jgi:hypothetical protein
MEIGEVTGNKDFVAYENCCREMGAIEKKLDNGFLPQGKREKLLYRKKVLEEKVLPSLAKRLNI